jgi:hypothetical protein
MQASLEVLPRDLVLLKTKRKTKASASSATSLVILLLTAQRTRVDHPSKALAKTDIRVKLRRTFLQLRKILIKTQTLMEVRKPI